MNYPGQGDFLIMAMEKSHRYNLQVKAELELSHYPLGRKHTPESARAAHLY